MKSRDHIILGYKGKHFHFFLGWSLGAYPVGLGLRLFYFEEGTKALINIDILFLIWDLQFGVHF